MARRIVIATHGRLAMGLQDALKILASEETEIFVINAFSEDQNPKKTVCDWMDSIPEEDTILAITDIMYGSVNQMFMPYVTKRKNFHLVTGVNLALVIELVLSSEEEMTSDFIREAIQGARAEMKYVDGNLLQLPDTEDDENDFF